MRKCASTKMCQKPIYVHTFKERCHLPKTVYLRSIKHVCKCIECKHPPPQWRVTSKRNNMLKNGPPAKTCKFPTAGSLDMSKNNRVSKTNMHVFLRSFHLLTNDFQTSKWDNLTLTVVQLRDPGTSLDTKSMRSVHQRKNVHWWLLPWQKYVCDMYPSLKSHVQILRDIKWSN